MNYKTVDHKASFEIEIKKSIFIGNAAPVTSEEEAIAFINDIRKTYSDARHNVYAYLLRENSLMRYSDDHEPQGSAGMPVLDVIRKSGITDVVVTVTRYFGGVLLGVGGLVRAYTDAAAGAIAEASVVEILLSAMAKISCTYSDYQRILPLLELHQGKVLDTVFEANVVLTVTFPYEDTSLISQKICDDTAGRASFELLKPEYKKW